VDNFRIDKYLMILRFQFSSLFASLKETGYQAEDLKWLDQVLSALLGDTNTALGIPLQICDVFLPELCKSDGPYIGFETIAQLINAFLHTAATTKSKVLAERIKEKVFDSLLESNVTLPDESEIDSEEEDLT